MKSIFNFFKNLFSRKPQTKQITQKVVPTNSREKFEKAMKFVRVVEGGLFNHPNDPGGLTNMGITQRDYPNLNIKKLTRKQADDIFYNDYWKRSYAENLPFPAYISYFDSVVNTGLSRANRILQKSAGVEQDGVIGPMTIEAVSKVNPQVLNNNIIKNRQNFYVNLAARNEKFRSFIKGWTRRSKALTEYTTTGSFSW